MKKILLMVGALLPFCIADAYAATEVYVHISSAAWGRVVVTSGSAVRVDQADYLATGSTRTLPNRHAILMENQDSSDDAYCAWSSAVSTDSTNSALGRTISADEDHAVSMDTVLQYHCKAADSAGAAGVIFHVQQVSYSKND